MSHSTKKHSVLYMTVLVSKAPVSGQFENYEATRPHGVICIRPPPEASVTGGVLAGELCVGDGKCR